MEKIKAVWKQRSIPVIVRKGKGFPLFVRLPYQKDNCVWLQNGQRNKPKWIVEKEYWEVPKAWFDEVVNRVLERWDNLYVIQPHVAHQKCATKCWEAKGHECECSCLGEYHGSQNPNGRWFIVSETFAVKYEAKELACRLLIKNK